jgi:putative transposase
MRHRLLVHVVWATRDRTPLLTLEAARFLSGYLGRICREEDATLVQFGAVRTHVHLLIRSHPARSLSRTIARLKGGSACVGRREHGLIIRWHPGYSLDSVSWRAIRSVASYIADQHRRHPREAIDGWRPGTAHLGAFLSSLERERYGGEHRRPHGSS